ncbi:cysteine hydrolase family protein [Algihabitans albus]|uniref:cysteine hydrolase family protein n=1 Tax=Algihabitans albus TaxID=2164067 RepID=UPI001ABC4634|nr:isochorismatase family cysteine hydrolase [Algihabitans albus]
MAQYIDVLNHEFRLTRGSCALLVVDMQYASGSRRHGLGKWLADQGKLADADYRFDRIETVVVPGIQRLLEAFRSAGETVIFLTLGARLPDYSDAPPHMRAFLSTLNNHAGTREHEILDELKPLAGELVLNKTTQGGFASSPLDSVLRAKGLTQIVAVGVSTNNCVETTAREASDRGFESVMVSDATGTCSDEMQDMTLGAFTRLWGRVLSVEEVVGELDLTAAAPGSAGSVAAIVA